MHDRYIDGYTHAGKTASDLTAPPHTQAKTTSESDHFKLLDKARQAATMMFASADANNDGAISLEEFNDFYIKHMIPAMPEDGSGAKEAWPAPQTFTVDCTGATYASVSSDASTGQPVYEALGGLEKSLTKAYKQTCVCYEFEVQSDGARWTTYRRYRSLEAWVSGLVKARAIAGKSLFPPKQSMGEANPVTRQAALSAFLKDALQRSPAFAKEQAVVEFFRGSEVGGTAAYEEACGKLSASAGDAGGKPALQRKGSLRKQGSVTALHDEDIYASQHLDAASDAVSQVRGAPGCSAVVTMTH